MSKVDVSFVIPTLNEEKNIPKVVGQFVKLNGVVNYEVIIADGGSKDKTLELARKYGARTCVNKAKKQTIAGNRNTGAGVAKGEILIFCDADTIFEDVVNFSKEVVGVFKDKSIIAAMPRIAVFPDERIWKDEVFSFFYNGIMKTSFFIRFPVSSGQCQVVRASAFRKVGGYNAKQVHAEDAALFKKLGKIGKMHYLDDFFIFESPRRYRKMGYAGLAKVAVKSIVGQAVLKRNILENWERVD